LHFDRGVPAFQSVLSKLLRMNAVEIAWRASTAGRIVFDRARTGAFISRWSRTALIDALAPLAELSEVRSALADHRWDDAQRGLSRHFGGAPRRFTVNPGSRSKVVERVRQTFPDAARSAARRADRIVAGRYDLLGFGALRFDGPGRAPGTSALPGWHLDPVHERTTPMVFWSQVPYLDPACGDHKALGELHRHQHWLTLGRAYWLTGDHRYRDRFVAELADWLEANPPLMGVNWASMLELAFRSISWVWAIQFFAGDAPDATPDSPWLIDLLVALDRQLTHVERNLSHYFSPNTHLLGEALALYVTGCVLPELASSGRRAATGRRILLQEIDRQIAADGGHCERSTHYHRYTLDFYALALIVARNTDDEAAAAFEEAVVRLGSAARLLANESGRIPHIGDDDGGVLTPLTGRDPDDLRDSLAIAAALVNRPDLQIEAAPEETLWLLGQDAASAPPAPGAGPVSACLPATGYYVSRAAGFQAVIDGGPHGYLNGGHAHADALSLTLSVGGVPVLIDPGTACYTTDPSLRDRFRSSALHNTVTIDERSQSLPRGPFHWSHVANARVHRWRVGDRFDYFDGSHDGYAPLEHRRRVLAMHDDLLVVADFIGGTGSHTADVHWHLDPRWHAERRIRGAVFTRGGESGGRVGLSIPDGCIDAFSADDRTGLGWCSPAYGRLDRTTTIRSRHEAPAPFWMVSVFDFDPRNAVIAVDHVPVWAEAGAVAHAVAVRITRTASVDHALFAEPGAGGCCRFGDVETDARMLFCRSTDGHPLVSLACVEGSAARPRHLDLRNREPLNQEPLNRAPLNREPECAASPVS
jgi:hypothetical protein